MIRNILVLGGGSAGFLAALILKHQFPRLPVRVIRSPQIGVIGVGEGTVPLFHRCFFKDLGLDTAQFYAEVQPTWKLGIRYVWGPRDHFNYSFSPAVDRRWTDLPKNNGFYTDDDFANLDLWSALMEAGKAFPRNEYNFPDFAGHKHVAFHMENEKLVRYLETRCRECGVEIRDATVREVELGPAGIAALLLDAGERLTADLFIDCSGFRSELLGRALQTPFVSYSDSLFCDRAIIGGWPRTIEPIKPYTTAETMEAGWCWQIEHEHWINRGYVFSSRFLSDEEALAELMRKNPRIANQPRLVPFRSGRYARMWQGNVVGIGNASGFVEPLEATALMCIVLQCRSLADMLQDGDGKPSPTMVDVYNRLLGSVWDEVRDFLAVHYKFNTRLDTPFWQAARADTALHDAAPLVDFYRENGPSALGRSVLLSANSLFGLEGYLAMFVGQKVPHQRPYTPAPQERQIWQRHRDEFTLAAQRAFTSEEMLATIRQPGWRWE